MFHGLSAFPLTPLINGEVDEKTFVTLIERLADAGVDSVGALGSTGSYAYLTREQRARVTQLAVRTAGSIPVMTSISSVRMEEILRYADDAQKAGVKGVLLAPVSYQKLSEEEVYDLYERISQEVSVPVCIYDNPATTGFIFNDALLEQIARLPRIGSIKLNDLPSEERIALLRKNIPSNVTIGISGDVQSAAGLLVGCDVWYSVIGGLFPRYSLLLAQNALARDKEKTTEFNSNLSPLWAFYLRHGSLRVIATVAEILGYVNTPCLPYPLKTLAKEERRSLEQVIAEMTFL